MLQGELPQTCSGHTCSRSDPWFAGIQTAVFCFLIYFVEVELIYTVVLMSTVQ